MMRLPAVALAAVALSGCGAQQATVVKRAFEQDVSSADETIALSVSSKDGETALGLSGPYRSNGKGKLPSVDFNVTVAGPLPQPIEAELISTGDDLFVVYQGETYQVGRDKLAQISKTVSDASVTREVRRQAAPSRTADVAAGLVSRAEPDVDTAPRTALVSGNAPLAPRG